MGGMRIAAPFGLAVALAVAALTIAPRGFEAQSLLASRDDPVALADHALARSFDAAVAAREIDGALAANDIDLAQSFLELARDRNVPVDRALAEKVEQAGTARVQRSLESFARGFVAGEELPDTCQFLGCDQCAFRVGSGIQQFEARVPLAVSRAPDVIECLAQ